VSREGRKKISGWYPETFVERVEAAAAGRETSIHALGIMAVNRALEAAGQSCRATIPSTPRRRPTTGKATHSTQVPARIGKKMIMTTVEEEVAWACKALALANRQSMEAWFGAVLEAEIKEGNK
jgi:hypothetical protein